MSARRYPEETKAQARELYAQGHSLRAIGRLFAVDHKTVAYWVDHEARQRALDANAAHRDPKKESRKRRESYQKYRKQNNPHASERSPRYPEETKAQARKLYASGTSLREIGRQLGVDHKTIRYWVQPATRQHMHAKSRAWYRAKAAGTQQEAP